MGVLQRGLVAQAHARTGLHMETLMGILQAELIQPRQPVNCTHGHAILHAPHAHGQRFLRRQVAAQRSLKAQAAVQDLGVRKLHGHIAVHSWRWPSMNSLLEP
jgi:hypothetical protein